MKKMSVFFIACILFLTSVRSYSSDKDFFSTQEIERSLKHLLIRYQGIYTLVGSKPITNIVLLGEPQQQRVKRYEQLSIEAKQNMSFEAFSRLSSTALHWNRWMSYWEKIKTPNYIFCKQGIHGYIVNVPHAVWIIHQYYGEFKELVGEDFHPHDLVLSIQDTDSKFWFLMDQCRSPHAHYLWGLLYGYGEKNAFLFKSMYEGMPGHFGFFHEEEPSNLLPVADDLNLTCDYLSVPLLRSFSPIDKEVDRYREEKAIIISKFQEKSFLSVVLNLLKPAVTD